MDQAKQQELEDLKSRFFANISHEFRTPLTLILGQNEQLQQLVGRAELQPKFDAIERNAQRLLDLINQVLDLSKLEAGKVDLRKSVFELVPFLSHIFHAFVPVAEQKSIELSFTAEADDIRLMGDTAKLERVFFNLFSNACKFTDPHGKVSVEISVPEEGWVMVKLTDSGIGIRPEKLPYIFDRFYQVKVEHTQTYTGTGIGLALVKELVEMHEGTIQASSKVGKGSVFVVKLPTATPAQVGNETAQVGFQLKTQTILPEVEVEVDEEEDQDDNRSRILIIDDNDEIRQYLKEELLQAGYRVFQGVNGKEGLSKAQAQIPDLIISDVMMPLMDGYEVAQHIRADERTSHIPLILLTAKASEESKIHGLKIGVDDYLFKPFSSSELKVRVANLILQRQRLRERFKTATVIKPSEVSVVPADQQFLQKVISFIEHQMSNPLFGVEDLGAEVGMSVTHLNRKLNALIDQPAGQLVRSMRMQRAIELLEKKAGNISEVAYDVGYSGPSHFTRSFKKHFGYPPSAYLSKKQTEGKTS